MSLPDTRAEALQTNSPKYFTGKPCKNGHTAYRYSGSGSCSACINGANAEARFGSADKMEKIRNEMAEAREARSNLVEMKLRVFHTDVEKMRALVVAVTTARYPNLTKFDIVSKKGMTDSQGGTGLHKFHMHPADITMLQGMANAMLRAGGQNGAVERAKVLAATLKMLDDEADPMPDFVP